VSPCTCLDFDMFIDDALTCADSSSRAYHKIIIKTKTTQNNAVSNMRVVSNNYRKDIDFVIKYYASKALWQRSLRNDEC